MMSAESDSDPGPKRSRGVKRKVTDDQEDEERTKISLDEALSYFTDTNNAQPKVRGNVKLQIALETIEQVARDTGLHGDILTDLVDIAMRPGLPVTVKTRIIKSLIPAEEVPRSAVLKALSWMCTNKPSSNIQMLLVRWIVLVYDSLESVDDLHNLYGIIFYFIDNAAMCHDVCRLLYLLTRKEDVKLFRIQHLLRLQRKMGPLPYIHGLLSVYKLYQPRYIMIPTTNKVYFRATDRVWASRIRAVLDRRKVPRPLGTDDGTTRPITALAGSKPSRRLLVPLPVPSTVAPPGGQTGVVASRVDAAKSEPVPFSQISSFSDLLKNLDRLELPSQIAAALRDRNLQHVLLCSPDPTTATRLAYWLDHVLCEEFLINPSKDKTRRSELLQMLISFSDFLKEGVPVCENFLVKYLHVWNGSDLRTEVLKLVSRFRIYPYHLLNDLLFEPLRKLFFSASTYFKCQLLLSLTALLKNFVLVELPRYKYCVTLQEEYGRLETTQQEHTNSLCVFGQEVPVFSAEETLTKVITYTNSLIEVGLTASGGSALLMHCVLAHYELVSGLHQEYRVPFVVLPPRAVVYRALFSLDASVLLRMCTIICRYRDGLMSLRSVPTSTLSDSHLVLRTTSLQKVHRLNRYILDFCDCLWRQRAFQSAETGSVFSLVDRTRLEKTLANTALGQTFSLLTHPALQGCVTRFMEKNLPKNYRLNAGSNKELRDGILKFLEMDNFAGIPHFISVNINRK